MSIVITLLVGLVVGTLAKLAMPGKDPGGIFVTMVLGIAGAFIAAMIGGAFGWYTAGEAPGLLASVLGSVVLLAIYRLATGRGPGAR